MVIDQLDNMFSWARFFEGVGMVFASWYPAKSAYPSSHGEKVLLHDWKAAGLEIKSVIDEHKHDTSSKPTGKREARLKQSASSQKKPQS